MEYMSELKKNNETLMLLGLLVGGFFTQLSTSTINIALPSFMEVFQAPLDQVRWTLTGFMLTTGIVAPVTCFLGEKFSYKRLYLFAIGGFTLSSLGCACSQSIQMLIFFRLLQGLFNGIIIPASMTVIYQVLEKKKQAFAMSLISFALTLAPALGPSLSGYILEFFGWKSIFLFNLPFGILTILLLSFTLPYYSLNPPKGFDFWGFLTSLLATALLLLAISNISIWNWNSLPFILCLASGAVFLVLFLYRQKKISYPILDLRVFNNRTFSVSMILRGVVTMGLYAGSLLTPLFLQQGQGSSALEAGLVLLPASVAMAITTIIIGRIYNRSKPVLFIQVGILSMCLGSYLLSRTSLETSTLYITGSLAFRNIGIALALSTTTMYGMASLDRKIAGNGSAVNNWITQSIGCFSIGLFTSLLSTRTQYHAYEYNQLAKAGQKALISGINDVYLVSVFIIFLGFLLSLLFYFNKKNKSEPDKADELSV